MGSQKVVHWEERRDAVRSRAERAHPGANSGLAHGPGARPARAHLRGSAPGWCAVASGPWAPARAAISCSRPRASRCLSGAAPVHPAKWLPRARRGSEALLPGRCSRRPPEGAPRPRLGLPATSGRPGRPRPFPPPPPSGLGADAGPRARADLRAERRMGAREEKSRGGGGGGGVPWPEAVWQRARCWGSLPAGAGAPWERGDPRSRGPAAKLGSSALLLCSHRCRRRPHSTGSMDPLLGLKSRLRN